MLKNRKIKWPGLVKQPKRVLPHQSGFSLIEILVAILLIAFGIAAMSGMLVYSNTSSTYASNRAIAVMLANDYIEIIRANRADISSASPGYATGNTAYNADDRNLPNLASGLCEYPSCTANTQAVRDKQEFTRRLRLGLPAGDHQLTKIDNNGFELWVLWSEGSGVINNQANESSLDNCPANILGLARVPRCYYVKVNL